MTFELFGDTTLARLGPVPVTTTMVTSAAVSASLLLLALVMGRALTAPRESKVGAASALVYSFLTKLVRDAAGRPSPVLEIFAGTLFLFIAGSAVLGQLPGVTAPTANLPSTSALALLVFLAIPVAGIHSRGLLAYAKEYVRPNPLLLPIHIISELSRTLALTLRLFGNMMSGHLVVAIIVSLVGVIAPVPLMALDLLIGVLQAYIFTILACVYVGATIRIEEEQHA